MSFSSEQFLLNVLGSDSDERNISTMRGITLHGNTFTTLNNFKQS